MPSRAFYHQTSDGCLSRKSQGFPFPQTFPSANELVENNFNLDMDEWDEWMKWEGPAASDRPESTRQYSTETSSSKASQWTSNININPQIDSNFNRMVLDDAPFMMNDSTVPDLDMELSSPDVPAGPEGRRQYSGYSSLTLDEEQQLRDIAMPSRKRSVVSVDTERESSYSPEPEARTRTKKRKSISKAVEVDAGELCQSRKRGHNAIEKRYRTNLNEKIVLLRESVPSLRVVTEGAVLDEEECDKDTSEKYGKAVILTRAVEYITHLEDCTERLGKEAADLKARVAAFEKLAMSGSIQMNGMPTSPAVKIESLESIKADFQQSTYDKAERIKAEPKPSKRRNSKKSTAL